MRVSKIHVAQLFARFNHTLEFKDDEHIAIMIGPNGFGKTMILQIIDAIFNGTFEDIANMPFKSIDVNFDNLSMLHIQRIPSTAATGPSDYDVAITYQHQRDQQYHVFQPVDYEHRLRELGVPREYIEESVPFIRRTGTNTWIDTRSGKPVSLGRLINHYPEYFQFLPTRELPNNIPDWLKDLRTLLPVRLIEIDRLVNTSVPQDSDMPVGFRRPSPPLTQRTVRLYSDDIGKQVNQKLTEYGTISQERDRTFPGRVVQAIDSSPLSDSDLHTQLSDIEYKRTEIVKAGLMPEDNPEWGGTALNQVEVNQSTKGVMTVYAQDAQVKLSVFDELLRKIQAFKRIANSRFLHKSISVGREGIKIHSSGSQLDLEMLSSGEQHELVMIYDLLFRVKKNSLILIDEPELSLHVAWQKQFFPDLEDMARLSDFQALVATHSPQIINDRWDLTIALNEPDA